MSNREAAAASERPLPECNCVQMYMAGAYPGWWCPTHRDCRADPSASEAIRRLHRKHLEADRAASAPQE
jgi:hypothetical protein